MPAGKNRLFTTRTFGRLVQPDSGSIAAKPAPLLVIPNSRATAISAHARRSTENGSTRVAGV